MSDPFNLFEKLEQTLFKEKIVRTRLLLMIGVCLAMSTMTAQAVITDVFIFPEEPIVTDPISIFVSGEEGSGPVLITDSVFNLESYEITLDISLEAGLSPVITPWDYTYDVGLLPEGIYGLTVNTLVPAIPSRNDTYITSFEVVPEPTTFLLISAGILCLRRNKNR